jgi:ATP phosphoribosyltransferase
MLTFALPKGSLFKDSIQLLQKAGLDFSAFLDESNRQLQITDPTGTAKALLVRAQDVPVYVEYGQAQMGIVGEDVLREKTPKVAKLVDLGFGGCRMSIAVAQASGYQSPLDLPPHSRIASKYVNCLSYRLHSDRFGQLIQQI